MWGVLFTPGDMEWGAERACPVCVSLKRQGYAEKWDEFVRSVPDEDEE